MKISFKGKKIVTGKVIKNWLQTLYLVTETDKYLIPRYAYDDKIINAINKEVEVTCLVNEEEKRVIGVV